MDLFNLPKAKTIALRNSEISSFPIEKLSAEEESKEESEEEEEGDRNAIVIRKGNIHAWRDLGFNSQKEWLVHCACDLYRFNQKRLSKGLKTVNEAEFLEITARGARKNDSDRTGDDRDDLESISGSGEDDLSSESEDEEDDLDRERLLNDGDKKRFEVNAKTNKSEIRAKIVFQDDTDRAFAIYRAILLPDFGVGFKHEEDDVKAKAEVAKALVDLQRDKEKPWVIILAKGGHFAAAVFDVSKIKTNSAIAPTESVLKSKTFHRYVVRAKAGGRQSVKDNAGKTIKSAGSSMRRQNEMALIRDVTNAMENWKQDYLNDAARIFISVSKTDARTLFDNNILNKKDPRVRKAPFMTARPTLNETKRTIAKLLSVTTADIEIVEKKDQQQKPPSSTINKDKSKLAKVKKMTKEDDETTIELAVEEEIPEPELHLASRNGDLEALTQMLESACLNKNENVLIGIDPSVPWRGKTAYSVAKDVETRDAFRRAYFKYPNAFEWESKCDVPSALTPEMEQKREGKEKEFEEKKKKKEAERKKAQKAAKKKASTSSASALLAAVEDKTSQKTTSTKTTTNKAMSAKDLLASENDAAAERRRTMAEAAERRANGSKQQNAVNNAPTKGAFETKQGSIAQ